MMRQFDDERAGFPTINYLKRSVPGAISRVCEARTGQEKSDEPTKNFKLWFEAINY